MSQNTEWRKTIDKMTEWFGYFFKVLGTIVLVAIILLAIVLGAAYLASMIHDSVENTSLQLVVFFGTIAVALAAVVATVRVFADKVSR